MRESLRKTLVTFGVVLVLCTVASASLNYFQGFESSVAGWIVSQGISRVPSGGGALHLPASSGHRYGEIQNLHDGYQAGYGDAGYSFYGGADSTYRGAFYQSIDVYIDVNWAAAAVPSVPGFWIDMTPYHADVNNYGAEHNFHITATGGAVDVTVDGQTSPIATLTSSGWYKFVMTWRKAPIASDPVITDMKVYNHHHTLVGTTTVDATSPGGPMASSDLKGNGYVWITLWQNGFAHDVLGIDNQRTGLLRSLDNDSDDDCDDRDHHHRNHNDHDGDDRDRNDRDRNDKDRRGSR